MAGPGKMLLDAVSPFLELIAPLAPGEIFPYFFTMELLQRALLSALLVTIVAGFLGTYLLIQNLALIGDGLAHVSFGGVALAIVLGASSPLWYALFLSTIASILIYEMQTREILTGDASIAIFLTGMLAFGLVILRLCGGGITTDIEGYLFGNLLLIDESSLNFITIMFIFSLAILLILRNVLLATAIDPISAQIQGLPVRNIGLLFSITTAAVVVSMVQVVGALLVTALLVTPAATAKLVANSFRSCLIWAQIFGFVSVLLGLYFSAELDTGSGAMIALVAALIFAVVAVCTTTFKQLLNSDDNL
ncbi:MAG: metal ABC transporter permease [Candidatus Poseidoniaceae archaeon]|jgi:ABC-type Mn2+/Zn2+ transport system permease subunit|nr:metal ABC transporter permease [Candidatus Poseidoniaceae archaeon]